MADAGDVYKQGDVMEKLGDEMRQMIEDKKKMIDPNHKNDDTDSEKDSSDEDNVKENDITFISAIDVGSHFIDVNPAEEIEFNDVQGHLVAQFNISNPCKRCHIAYFVYTSAPININIVPNCGFIPAEFSKPIKIVWEKEKMPDPVKLENSMFFVKALPLSPQMDVEQLSSMLSKVFNTYNVNILFTTHHLRCKVNQNRFDPAQMQQMQMRQMQMMQQQMRPGMPPGPPGSSQRGAYAPNQVHGGQVHYQNVPQIQQPLIQRDA
jgi:hypothetical protein